VRQVTLDGGIVRTLLTFEAADGTAIPAFLFRPKTTRPAPAALVIPGHGRGIVDTAGLTGKSYQHGIAFALARAGFISLSPELRGFGYLGARLGSDHVRLARRALRDGTFYYAIVLHDLRIALALLSDDPDVDRKRIAVTGCSLGGDLSLTLGALDQRIGAVVAQGLLNWRGPRGTWPTPEEEGSVFSQDLCSLIQAKRSGLTMKIDSSSCVRGHLRLSTASKTWVTWARTEVGSSRSCVARIGSKARTTASRSS